MSGKRKKDRIPTRHVPVGTAELGEGGLVKTLDSLSDPLGSLQAAAEACGLEASIVKSLVKRVKAQYQPILQEMRAFKTSELLGLLEDRAGRALQYLDDYKLSAASAKDLAIITGILLEKRQLLSGEPTHILSHEDRMSLNKLAPALEAEFRRRGFLAEDRGDIIDITPTVVRPGKSSVHSGKKTGNTPLKLKQLAMKREIGEP